MCIPFARRKVLLMDLWDTQWRGQGMTESQRIRKSVCQSAGNLNSLAVRVTAAKPVRTLDLNRLPQLHSSSGLRLTP